MSSCLGVMVFFDCMCHRSIAVSPTASGLESDRLPTPEREHRQALEYEEDEAPLDTSEVVKEADVSFPNLPIPKSSDGNVSLFFSASDFLYRRSNSLSRIGLFACLIL